MCFRVTTYKLGCGEYTKHQLGLMNSQVYVCGSDVSIFSKRFNGHRQCKCGTPYRLYGPYLYVLTDMTAVRWPSTWTEIRCAKQWDGEEHGHLSVWLFWCFATIACYRLATVASPSLYSDTYITQGKTGKGAIWGYVTILARNKRMLPDQLCWKNLNSKQDNFALITWNLTLSPSSNVQLLFE